MLSRSLLPDSTGTRVRVKDLAWCLPPRSLVVGTQMTTRFILHPASSERRIGHFPELERSFGVPVLGTKISAIVILAQPLWFERDPAIVAGNTAQQKDSWQSTPLRRV